MTQPRIEKKPFGALPDGTPVELYALEGPGGLRAAITTWGAAVVSLEVPDAAGARADVLLGFDDLAGFLAKENPYFGCIVGRYANRIASGRFTLDGKAYTLASNDGENHLHGGRRGFDKVVWTAKPVAGPAGPSLELTYALEGRRGGLPGQPLRPRCLHPGRRRAPHRLRRHHRQAHAGQPHQPRLLQPGGRGERDDPRPRAAARRRRASRRRPRPHPDRRAAGRGRARRSTSAPRRDRRPDRRRRRAAQAGRRLRPQLGARPGRRGALALRAGGGAAVGPGDGGLDHRAGRPVLLRQLPRRHAQRQGRQGLPAPRRLLPRDPALPRLAQPAGASPARCCGPASATPAPPSTGSRPRGSSGRVHARRPGWRAPVPPPRASPRPGAASRGDPRGGAEPVGDLARSEEESQRPQAAPGGP